MAAFNRIAKWLAPAMIAVAAGLVSPLASAQLAGHNLILVHGLILDDVVNKPSREEILARRKVSTFWQERAEGYLNWSGADRLEGGIAEIVFEQARDLAERGVCDQGCVLLTHSTGDLVARYFMAHQEAWMRNAGLEPLNIVATLDFAGAGGGTDLADFAVGAVMGSAIAADFVWAAGAMLGIDLSEIAYSELGVLIDLQTHVARNHAMWPQDIPRLRFSVSGGDLTELGMGQVRTVTKTMLRGADDTVVPAHSTCGAASPWAYESCSSSVAYDGKREWEFGPGGLLHNHFPVLMAADYDHFTLTQDQHQGKVTYVLNNFDGGLQVDFATRTKTITARWWEVWKETGTWQYVQGSGSRSMSSLVYDTLNY